MVAVGVRCPIGEGLPGYHAVDVFICQQQAWHGSRILRDAERKQMLRAVISVQIDLSRGISDADELTAPIIAIPHRTTLAIVDCGDAVTGPVTQVQPAFVRRSELRKLAAAVALILQLFSSSIAKPGQITKRPAGAGKKRLYLSVKPFQIVMLKRTRVPTHLVIPSGVVGIDILR